MKKILIFFSLFLASCGQNSNYDPLPSWNDGDSKQAIIDFVTKVTKENSEDFIDEADRIAVFDNDGTLWVEKPIYTQLAFALDRVKAMSAKHPEWQNQAPFKAILADDKEAMAKMTTKDLLQIIGITHSGMTEDEFAKISKEWLANTKHPVLGRTYLQSVYQPQLELLAYLRANGFKTYIASAGGTDMMRPWTEEIYGIPPEQILGSSLKAEYKVINGKPVVTKLPDVNFVDDKAGKPVGIHQFIGKKPVLAFGNSDGDFEMLEYVSGNDKPSLALLVHHDDAEREFAYDRDSHVGKLVRGLDEADERGWILVSMKNDWNKIFPDIEKSDK